MKKPLFSFLFLLLLFSIVSAQEKESRKVGELPSFWQCDYVIQLADNFLFELQNNPQSTGFVIYYEGKYANDTEQSETKMFLPRRGEADFRVQIIRNHIKLRKQNPERVLFINGGFLEEQKTEFWIVPKGADLPKPRPTIGRMEYRKGKPFWKCDL